MVGAKLVMPGPHLDPVPRTSAGKFLKSALREEYRGWKASGDQA